MVKASAIFYIAAAMFMAYVLLDMKIWDYTFSECRHLRYVGAESDNWFRRTCTDFVKGVRTEVPIEEARRHWPAYLVEGTRAEGDFR